MVSELLSLIAVASAGIGAVFATLQGYWAQEGGYSIKKLLSALISSAFVSFGLVNLSGVQEQYTAIGYMGVIIGGLLLGYGTDRSLSALDK